MTLPIPFPTAIMLNAVSGSAQAPSYTFIDNLGTGMFRTSADDICLSTGGVARILIGADNIAAFEPLLFTSQVAPAAPADASELRLYKKTGVDGLFINTIGGGEQQLAASGAAAMTWPLVADLSGTTIAPAYSFLADTAAGMYYTAGTGLAFSSNTDGGHLLIAGATQIAAADGLELSHTTFTGTPAAPPANYVKLYVDAADDTLHLLTSADEARQFSTVISPAASTSTALVRWGDTSGSELINSALTLTAGGLLTGLATPAGTTDATNKEYVDEQFSTSNFAVYDSADATKRVTFTLSAISTGTTRDVAVPDEPAILPSIFAAGSIGLGSTSYQAGADNVFIGVATADTASALAVGNVIVGADSGALLTGTENIFLGRNITQHTASAVRTLVMGGSAAGFTGVAANNSWSVDPDYVRNQAGTTTLQYNSTTSEVSHVLVDTVALPVSSVDRAVPVWSGTGGDTLINSTLKFAATGVLSGLATPLLATDAATKDYVDSSQIAEPTDLSTGLKSGGILSVASATTYQYTAGTGQVINPVTNTKTIATWATATRTLSTIGVDPISWVAIDSAGAIVEQNEEFTPFQRQSNIVLGAFGHQSNNIIGASTAAQVAVLPNNRLTDYMNRVGLVNSGNVVTGNSGAMTLQRSSGRLTSPGINWANMLTAVLQNTGPDTIQYSAASLVGFTYVRSPGNSFDNPFFNTTVVNPNLFDLPLTSTPGSNRWTIQRIWLIPGPFIAISPGQFSYNSLNQARQQLPTESFTPPSAALSNAIIRAFMILQINTSDMDDVYFIENVDAGSGSAGGPGDVLGPSASADTSVATFSGTSGAVIQDNVVTISAAGLVAGAIMDDGDWAIAATGDNTKLLDFDCSAITTGTTRTATVPNSDVILASLNPGTSTNTIYVTGAAPTSSSGAGNTAVGRDAGATVTTGADNVCIGQLAGGAVLATGSNNVIIGADADVATESFANCIVIGDGVVATATAQLRIGAAQTETFIDGIHGVTIASSSTALINALGQLGTIVSSRRFKHEIADMVGAERLYSLQPRNFKYTADRDPEQRNNYGLIAEEVDEVMPEFVVKNSDGQCQTVQYFALIAPMLDLLIKQNKKIETIEAQLSALR